MGVTLRKRKVPADPPSTQVAPVKKRTAKSSPSTTTPASNIKATDKKRIPKQDNQPDKKKPTTGSNEVKQGEKIELDSFANTEVLTNEDTSTTLTQLLEQAKDADKRGIAIFTYPKASTPGCTTQACLFRDAFDELGAKLDVYGLSADSPKANSKFKEKQELGYVLLCDTKRELITMLGLAKNGGGGTARGVVVVDVDGVVVKFLQGGPAATVDVVKEAVEEME